MNSALDFAHPPAQRRRLRERRFHHKLCVAALLGILLAAMPALRLWLHQNRLQAANALLVQETQALASATEAVTALQARIAALQQQVAQQQRLTERRAQAGTLLRGIAQASHPQIQLERLQLHSDRAELRGQASSMQAIQDLLGALTGAGLEGARLLDLRTQASAAVEGYAWSLSIPLQAASATDAAGPP